MKMTPLYAQAITDLRHAVDSLEGELRGDHDNAVWWARNLKDQAQRLQDALESELTNQTGKIFNDYPPLTTCLSGESRAAWAQREYAAATARGHGFSPHGKWWHYKLGSEFLVVERMGTDVAGMIIGGTIQNQSMWLEESLAAVAEFERRR